MICCGWPNTLKGNEFATRPLIFLQMYFFMLLNDGVKRNRLLYFKPIRKILHLQWIGWIFYHQSWLQHVIAFGSIRNLNTGLCFAINLVKILPSKLTETCSSYWVNSKSWKRLIFAINLENFLASKLTATCNSYWIN